MAFKITDLSVLAYANGFTLWHLKTTDNIDDVDTQGYLNSANEMLRVGDMIIVSALDKVGFVSVATNDNGVVDAKDPLTLPVSDTD
ncbi:MAG: hypothetical protein ACJ0GZ_02250 [Alphaproteobacteria bacterium]